VKLQKNLGMQIAGGSMYITESPNLSRPKINKAQIEQTQNQEGPNS